MMSFPSSCLLTMQVHLGAGIKNVFNVCVTSVFCLRNVQCVINRADMRVMKVKMAVL